MNTAEPRKRNVSTGKGEKPVRADFPAKNPYPQIIAVPQSARFANTVFLRICSILNFLLFFIDFFFEKGYNT